MTSSLILSVVTFLYLGAALAYLIHVIFRWELAGKAGFFGLVLTVAAQTGAIILRWVESYRLGIGHAPLSNLYESLVFGSWAIGAIYIWVEMKYRHRALGVFPAFCAFLAMAYASFDKDMLRHIQPLVPALKSNWLIAHVIACFLGYAGFTISCGIAILYLLRAGKKESSSSGIIPGNLVLEELVYQTVLFGHLLLTVGIVTGSIWANSAWGTYWSWDPKETWSLITWLIYLALLHARIVRGWRGSKIAVISILGFASMLFTFFGVNFLLSGLHSYAS